MPLEKQAKVEKHKLRVLMLTWEYPPRIIGGISRVVEGLSRALVRQGVEVHVITNEMTGAPMEANDEGVFVHRVQIESPTPNFYSWVLMMNHYFAKRAGRLYREVGKIDIVHVHDWLTLTSGAEAKSFLGNTLVSTLHSLEFKRSGGINTPESTMVDSLEWWATYESSIVVVCSGSMKKDTQERFRVPEGKIWVIPIGIDQRRFERSPNQDSIRGRYGVSKEEKLLLFVGRLTSQKGCEYLVRALPYIAKYHNVKLLVVGDGYMRPELERIASSTAEGWRTKFLGFLQDSDLTDLLLCSDVMMIPSVYEPFGVVALEGMAAGVPVVASNIDGLAEIIRHEENGILAFPRDSSSIAWAISRVLSNPSNTARLVENARRDVATRFSWDAVARLTLQAYQKAMGQSEPI
ncbi:MAG: glycosyltransferase family 4 protein [Candidatus Marsarchaeota archaeon]|nr:glycosyltransferase family 4 protein [Candidatus Marsarchaeota archaeon]